jgi:hypothetical protein
MGANDDHALFNYAEKDHKPPANWKVVAWGEHWNSTTPLTRSLVSSKCLRTVESNTHRGQVAQKS